MTALLCIQKSPPNRLPKQTSGPQKIASNLSWQTCQNVSMAKLLCTQKRLGPCWVRLSPCWVRLGPCWVRLGPCWVMFARSKKAFPKRPKSKLLDPKKMHRTHLGKPVKMSQWQNCFAHKQRPPRRGHPFWTLDPQKIHRTHLSQPVKMSQWQRCFAHKKRIPKGPPDPKKMHRTHLNQLVKILMAALLCTQTAPPQGPP